MNKQKIINSVEKLENTLASSRELFECSNVQWKTQDCDSDSILFYKLTENNRTNGQKLLSTCTAKIVILSEKCKINQDYIVAPKDSFMEMQKIVCDYFYPMHKVKKIIGVTGTNGKTTTTYLLNQIFTQAKVNSSLVGTLGFLRNGEKKEEFSLTTPSYIDLRKALSKHSKDGDVLILEVSSHGLDQKRLYKIDFDLMAWTSFSQDHLDTYESMDSYFESKLQVFDVFNKKVTIPASQNDLIQKVGPDRVEVCKRNDQSLYADGFFEADYNKDNLDICIHFLKELKVSLTASMLSQISYPPGRFQLYQNKKQKIIIDFAHTPDALKNLLIETKKTFKKNMITVFGCGGDRDRSKRSQMASISEEYSDYVIVTSDNPRLEEPELIIKDIVKGFTATNYEIEVDRKLAIIKAMKQYSDSIIVIAGKGHEPYIDIKGVKHPYSDEIVVKEVIDG